MITKSIKIGVMVCGGLMVSLSAVSAQTGASAEAKAEPPAEAAVDARSPAEILEQARVAVDRMEASADNIGRMLRLAREKKDVVKILCLDDKLSQMGVAARSAGDRLASIEAASSAGNAERARHDEDVLNALSARGNEIMVEANQCIGEESGAVGGSKLNVTVDPSIPKAVTGAPTPYGIISSPPVAASPTI